MTIPDPLRAVGRMIGDGAQGLLTLTLFAFPVALVLIGIPWLISWVIGVPLGEVVIALMTLLLIVTMCTAIFLWLKEQYDYRMIDIRCERQNKERNC